MIVRELLKAWRSATVTCTEPGFIQDSERDRKEETKKGEEVRTEREQAPGAEAGMREEGCRAVWV